MENILTFNIETIGRVDLPDDLAINPADIEIPQTSKGVKLNTTELVEKYRAEKYRELKSKLSLSPLTSQIVAISTKRNDEPTKVYSGLDEKLLLTTFIDDVLPKGGVDSFGNTIDRFVTFNGKSFDIPHIISALIRHNLSLPFSGIEHLTSKYNNVYHCDVRLFLTSYNSFGEGTLGDWCSAYGLPRPFGFGSMVALWAEIGDWESLEKHCLTNVESTHALFRKIERFIL